MFIVVNIVDSLCIPVFVLMGSSAADVVLVVKNFLKLISRSSICLFAFPL